MSRAVKDLWGLCTFFIATLEYILEVHGEIRHTLRYAALLSSWESISFNKAIMGDAPEMYNL